MGATPEANRFNINPETGMYEQTIIPEAIVNPVNTQTSTIPSKMRFNSATGMYEQYNDTGLFGMGTTDQWGTAMGLGGLAMKAIALPGELEYNSARTDLAKQQIASNNQAMADKKTFNNTWASASNGLAARSVG